MGALLIAALILCSLAIGALAVDFSHMDAVRSELQNAVDAAALAGASDLVNNPDQAETHAIEVAAANTADGRPLTNDGAGTTVSVQVTPSTGSDPGEVEVSASITVEHLLAKIFGRNSDTLTARSTAGGGNSIVSLSGNQAFPLAVSIDAVPGN